MTTKDIVVDYSASGTGEWSKAAFTITASANSLVSPTGLTWAGSDAIVVGNAGGPGPQGGSPLLTTISSITNANKTATLAANALHTLPFSDVDGTRTNFIVSWGANDGVAFNQFRTDFTAQTVTLNIPTGGYLVSSGNFFGLFQGPSNIIVNATGATIAGGTFQLGGGSQGALATTSARINTVLAGSTSVTCLTAAQASRFPVNSYALVAGLPLQYGGYPSSHFLFEYVKITGNNTGTGVVTFNRALTYSYKSTWPDLFRFPGSTFNPATDFDSGAPAALYAMTSVFDHTEVINGLTVAHDAQFGVTGLSATLNDMTFHGDFSVLPSQSGEVSFNRCSALNATMEYDKYNSRVTMTGPGTWSGIQVQSSNEEFILDNQTITFTVLGTAKKTTIRNGCNIGTLAIGADYGYNKLLTVTDSAIANLGSTTGLIAGAANAATDIASDFSMSGGIITCPNSFYPSGYMSKWMVEGAYLFFYDSAAGSLGLFRILDITQDATNTYVHTNWTKNSGGFPPVSGGAKLYLFKHPAESVTFNNVTGSVDILDLVNAPDGAPLWSYSRRSYTNSITTQNITVMGVPRRITVTVNAPYTGVNGSAQKTTISAFAVKDADASATTFSHVIDLTQTGTRTLDCTQGFPAAWSGAQSGDTLHTVTSAPWFQGLFQMTMPDITGESGVGPAFTVEVETDQGIEAFRVHFRYHKK